MRAGCHLLCLPHNKPANPPARETTMNAAKSSRVIRVPLDLSPGRLVRGFFKSDLMVTTLAILFYTGIMCVLMFFLSWAVYNERYGISVRDFLMLAL